MSSLLVDGPRQGGQTLLSCPREALVQLLLASSSLSAAVGMDDLIWPDSKAYVERAIELGRDPEPLRQRRQRLLDPGAHLPLFDTAGWVRHWEELLHGLLRCQAGNDSDRTEADAMVA
jgi:hypothetical protein